jgi:hypothetical protein
MKDSSLFKTDHPSLLRATRRPTNPDSTTVNISESTQTVHIHATGPVTLQFGIGVPQVIITPAPRGFWAELRALLHR